MLGSLQAVEAGSCGPLVLGPPRHRKVPFSLKRPDRKNSQHE